MNQQPPEPKPLRPPMATEILPLLEAEAKQRQVANLRQGADAPVPLKLGERNSSPTPVPLPQPKAKDKESSHIAAKQMNVSGAYVSDAKKLKAEACP